MNSSLQIFRKKVVIQLSQQSLSQAAIAKAVDLSQGRVSQILQEVKNNKGQIQSPAYQGAKSKLTLSQKQKLKELIAKGADFHGFQGAISTSKRLVKLIRDLFDVRYHLDHIPKLLRAMGYSLQKPKKQDIRKDHKAILNWREQKIKEVKKGLNKTML